VPPGRSHEVEAIWAGVDRLVDHASDEGALILHRLEPFAARRLRALGREVPEGLAESERLGAAFALAASVHLERARAAVDGPLLVMKGPELAVRYPDPALRIYRDLDLLAPDPHTAQNALVAAGFVEVGDSDFYEGAPHLLPLAWPGLPMEVEIHDRPNWPRWLEAPTADELFVGARPSACGVGGVLAPAPERHALVLAAHAWTHGPLERARDLVDVALMTAESDRDEIDRVAAAWGMAKLWRTTIGIAEALLLDGTSLPLRVWGRNLSAVRDRTVLGRHLAGWTAWYAALPLRLAVRASVAELRADLSPARDEGWPRKIRRSGRAVRNAFVRKSEHDRGAASKRAR
jgi:hypothetical protein